MSKNDPFFGYSVLEGKNSPKIKETEMSKRIPKRYQQQLFKRITLSLASVFYLYPVPDEAVWDAVRCLDKIFRKELGMIPREVEDARPHKYSQGRKHPAVTELLKRLDNFSR